jgi:hypothetical protein
MTDRCATSRRPASRRGLAVAAVLAVLLGTAGCGGDDPPGAAGGPATPPASPGSAPVEAPADNGGAIPQACALLSPAEIESATGAAYRDGETQEVMSFGDQTACNYHPADGGSAFVLVVVNGTGASFDVQREAAEDGLGTPAQDVAGVGDAAYWMDETDTLATHAGDTYLQVTLAGGDQETVADLVRAAVAKL